MKTILLIFYLNFLLLFTCCNGQTNNQPKIDFIITNDYMSERNLTLMGGPIPSNYKKEIIDSLRNSFVEIYDANNNIVQQKFYNSIGVLYHTNQKFYDYKNRLEKSVEIDEFKVDTCTTSFKYTDSLNLLIHKRLETSCKEDFLDFYYQYNDKGVRTEELLKENNTLIRRKAI